MLSCIVPAASQAGLVDVTLSRSVDPGAPEYGVSLAGFEYHSDNVSL